MRACVLATPPNDGGCVCNAGYYGGWLFDTIKNAGGCAMTGSPTCGGMIYEMVPLRSCVTAVCSIVSLRISSVKTRSCSLISLLLVDLIDLVLQLLCLVRIRPRDLNFQQLCLLQV
jgi:hypothetical protein